MFIIMSWVPAIVLPTATALQLIKMAKNKGEGNSATAWFLFAAANLGLYIYMEKYFEIQSILGLLLTAVLDFIMLFIVLYYNKRRPKIKI